MQHLSLKIMREEYQAFYKVSQKIWNFSFGMDGVEPKLNAGAPRHMLCLQQSRLEGG
jgi:hypothetical protein